MYAFTRATMLAAIAGCLLSLAPAEAAKPVNSGGGGSGGNARYRLVPLPDASGSIGANGYAWGMQELYDDSGAYLGAEIVGVLDGTAYDWMLDASGAVIASTPLPLPDVTDPENEFTTAEDVNAAGMIVGGALNTSDTLRAIVWTDAGSAPLDLPLPPDFVGDSRPFDINNAGLTVGLLYDEDGTRDLVAWGVRTDGTAVGPQLLVHGFVSLPDVNDAGETVATVNGQGYRWQVDWDGQDLTVSPPVALTGSIDDGSGSVETVPLRVNAVNEFGDVCGTYFRSDGSLQAYLLTAGGTLIDMAPLVDNRRQGTTSPIAADLNDAADASSVEVIGIARIYDKRDGIISHDYSVMWQGDQVTDLNAVTEQPDSQFQVPIDSVEAVSDHGWILGFTWDDNLHAVPVVLVPNRGNQH